MLTEMIEPATLSEAQGQVHATLSGTFLRKNARSLNSRLYPADTVERMVTHAQQRLSAGSGLPIQMLDRHATADTDESLRVVGKVTRVWLDGDNARYEAEVPNTAAGREMATLVDGGFIRGVSLRASNPVVEHGEVDGAPVEIIRGAELQGIDLTLTPGIESAHIDGIQIFESVDPARVTILDLEEEALPGAGYARAWYETLREAQGQGLLEGVQLDRFSREVLPLYEAAQRFEKPGEYTAKDREKIPADSFAGPNRTFPIVTQQDVHDAARLVGHAADPEAVKAKISAIARRKGFDLPDAWQSKDQGDKGKDKDKDKERESAMGAGATTTTSEATSETESKVTEAAPLSAEDLQSRLYAAVEKRYGSPWAGAANSGASVLASFPDAVVIRNYQDGNDYRLSYTVGDDNGVVLGAAEQVQVAYVPVGQESAPQPQMTPASRAERVLAAFRTIREAQLDDDDMEQVKHLVAAADNATDQLMGLLGIPDVDMSSIKRAVHPPENETQEESAAGAGELREAGKAISAANADKLAQAHDHLATVLGLECAPGQGSEEDDMGESGLSKRDVQALIGEALGKQADLFERALLRRETAVATAPAPAPVAAVPAVGPGPSADVAALLEAVGKLTGAVAQTQAQVQELSETLPQEAAKIAEQTAWRTPERQTHLVENRDVGRGGEGTATGEPTIQEKLADRSIPVETRMRLAERALAEGAPDIQLMAALGLDVDGVRRPVRQHAA